MDKRDIGQRIAFAEATAPFRRHGMPKPSLPVWQQPTNARDGRFSFPIQAIEPNRAHARITLRLALEPDLSWLARFVPLQQPAL